jgi:retinol dehydrogenase 12
VTTHSQPFIVVTGGNSGIGLATVTELARRGATVVLVARDRGKADAAAHTARQAADAGTVEVMIADLSLQADVRRLAAEIGQRSAHLDVLINNAAIIPAERQMTADGIETQLAVNHLAPFLLTNLLLGQLRAAPQGRVVTVSSIAHRNGRVDFDDLQHERSYDQPKAPTKGWQAYCDTKLMNIMFSNALARRLDGTAVTTNSLHPGVIASNLWRTMPGPKRWIGKKFMKSEDRGSRTSVYLATSPEVATTTGRYFLDNCNETDPSPQALDAEVQEHLWTVSEQLVGLAAS